ncbi:hypothetical protein D9619_000003 [Psilocybe cf. subviscida]|uniref:Uncharacterized protein n=1 Tax=Psilocybe cf. subviscida TaxID=2480587 RepID=A0A8H5F1U7_9AGAR|nr:hypothetical protein D9619_000003 [Psilocybe cf. subviscida]
MAFSEQKAAIVSLFVQSVAYGFFCFLFCQSTSVIINRYSNHPETRRVNTKLLVVSALMFLLATMHVSMTVYRVLDAFVSIGCSGGDNDRAIISRLTDAKSAGYIIGSGTYGIQTVLGDGFMVCSFHES